MAKKPAATPAVDPTAVSNPETGAQMPAAAAASAAPADAEGQTKTAEATAPVVEVSVTSVLPPSAIPTIVKQALGEVVTKAVAAKAKKIATTIVVVGPEKGRWRAKRFFTREATSIGADELSSEDMASLQGDPELHVTLVDAPY